MFNLQGSEIIIILLLALVVLGPEKLPEAMRRAGRFYADIKKMSSGFQEEFRSALDEPAREMRETANMLRDSADFTKLQAGDRTEKPKSAEMTDAAAPAAGPVEQSSDDSPGEDPAGDESQSDGSSGEDSAGDDSPVDVSPGEDSAGDGPSDDSPGGVSPGEESPEDSPGVDSPVRAAPFSGTNTLAPERREPTAHDEPAIGDGEDVADRATADDSEATAE